MPCTDWHGPLATMSHPSVVQQHHQHGAAHALHGTVVRRLGRQVHALCASSTSTAGTGRYMTPASAGRSRDLSTGELESWRADGFLHCRAWWSVEEGESPRAARGAKTYCDTVKLLTQCHAGDDGFGTSVAILRVAMETDPKLGETNIPIANAVDFSVWFQPVSTSHQLAN